MGHSPQVQSPARNHWAKAEKTPRTVRLEAPVQQAILPLASLREHLSTHIKHDKKASQLLTRSD